MTHRGQPRELFAELRKTPRERYVAWRGDLPLPEHLAAKRRPMDPLGGALAMGVVPLSLFAAVLGPSDWSWWQRVVGLLAGLALSVYPTLLIVGYWRVWRRRAGGSS